MVEVAKPFQTNPDAFVLSGTVSQYVEPRTMQNRFQTYVKQSGIASVNFHSMSKPSARSLDTLA